MCASEWVNEWASEWIVQMGYCAKAIMYKSVCWTRLLSSLLIVFMGALHVQCIVIPGKTSPGMRTYDIWGAVPKNEPIQSERNTVTSNNDVLLQDYSQKTSLRHGKGSLHSMFYARTKVCES